MSTVIRKMIIIGGGPAGYTAALYAARANLEPLVIEGFQWGGQLMITSDVENYPGYPEGVLGPEMMAEFRRQAERFGAEFITDDVARVDFSERPFSVFVADEEYRAESVVVATGATARQLGIPSEKRLQGKGVTYCAVCDAAFWRDVPVAVVGGGDSAMEEAIFLTKFASKVSVIHRRDDFRASPIMLDRAQANEKIEFVTNAVVDEVLGDPSMTGLRLRSTTDDETFDLDVRAVFIAIGHDPTTSSSSTGSTTTRRATRDEAGVDGNEHSRRVRGRRRAGPRLPAGGHCRRVGLHGGTGRRAVPRLHGGASARGARCTARSVGPAELSGRFAAWPPG